MASMLAFLSFSMTAESQQVLVGGGAPSTATVIANAQAKAQAGQAFLVKALNDAIDAENLKVQQALAAGTWGKAGRGPQPMDGISASMPISLDYSGPYSSLSTDANWTDRPDGFRTNYYNNYYGCTLASYQTNSWSVVLTPNRDQADPNARVPHTLAFRLGVLGDNTETITASVGYGTTNQTIATLHGSGWPTSSSLLSKWVTYTWNASSTNSGTNDVTLTFTYVTGNLTNHLYGANNFGGVDYLCWEAKPVLGAPLLVRIENQFTNTPLTMGPFGEYGNYMKISWVNDSDTTYNVQNTFKLLYSSTYYSVNPVLGPYYLANNNGSGFPIYNDLTGTRYTCYFMRDKAQMCFILHKQ